MKREYILLVVVIVLLLYPGTSAYLVLPEISREGIDPDQVEEAIVSYQLSIWITWLVLTIISIYQKWTTEKNVFFFITYGFLLIAFGIFGYFIQEMATKFNLSSGFEDNYSFGVFTAIQHFAIAAILTGFLQAAVWWFTRKWHRR